MIQKCVQHITKENLLNIKSIRTLKNKIFKHMTSISKNDQVDTLDEIFYNENGAC